MKKWFKVILFICITASSNAQNSLEKIDKLVSFCEKNGMFNGNILVAEEGKIIYHKSIGIADFENRIPLDLNTSFCLGSISKQFTAFAIMVLNDQAKLSYATTVGEIFPELPRYMHKITLKNLMQHTSGLKRTHYGEQDGLKNEEIYQNFLKTEGDSLLFEPGTDLSYSNSGYMLLAMIVERVSGQSYESFLLENVWKPLGMTNTFVMNEADYTRPNRAIGFDGFGLKADFNVLTYGSNGVYSTTEDLFRWTQSFTTDLVMDPEDKSEAWKPAISNSGEYLEDSIRNHRWNYGFGYFIYKDNLKGIVGHSGAFGGFLNVMSHDFKNNRTVVILTSNGRLLPIHDLHIAVQNILNGTTYLNPKISIDWELRKSHYNDIDNAIQYYYELKKHYPDKYQFEDEWELNALAYALMADRRFADAIKVLRLLVEELPDQPNPYDSLGEAYYLNGQYNLSIESYEKALEIDPTYNTDWIMDMLKKNKEKLAATQRKQNKD